MNTHPVAEPLTEIALDLVRYGIDVANPSVQNNQANRSSRPDKDKPTNGGEVVMLPTELVISDYPVTGSWCEIVPVRRTVKGVKGD